MPLTRRRLLVRALVASLAAAATRAPGGTVQEPRTAPTNERPSRRSHGITLFLCGDVMTGRGIDQILPHPAKPHLYEPYMRSALGYVQIAEQATGPMKRPVDFAYLWGDALAELDRAQPDARVINLETAVTASEDAWPGKGIHYRMHPANVPCLAAAKIDCCVLANNHVLDWGYRGLAETVQTLRGAGIRTAGAGNDHDEAVAPAVIVVPGTGRVLVYAFATESSGVPRGWAARKSRAGVSFLPDLSAKTADAHSQRIAAAKRPGDIVVASIHWGGNWGYAIPPEQRAFAHRLIDAAAVDVVHGHSSHHVKGIEVYRDKPILYGCGDFLNDYEGIAGHESFRADLGLMYFPQWDAASGGLARCTMTPTQIRHFRVNRAPDAGVRWLEQVMNREGAAFGTRVARTGDNRFLLEWR
ncbi:MAG: CapA family protein [Betaproteobacteria bacterium]|nr:CapA family protein [Betaproteobacteria bacterium]